MCNAFTINKDDGCSHLFATYSKTSDLFLFANQQFLPIFLCKLTGLAVFNILIANLSILRWASPNLENASLAAGCGSLTPIAENTSPNAVMISQVNNFTR